MKPYQRPQESHMNPAFRDSVDLDVAKDPQTSGASLQTAGQPAGLVCVSRWRSSFLILGAVAALGLGAIPSSANAEDWVFQRSYFSHVPPEGTPPEPWLPKSRSAYRTAYYGEIPSLSFRSELRINNRVLRNGPRTDHSIQAEGFIQFQP